MIRKRNLDPGLISWIRSQGIGPMIGEIFYLADVDDAHYQQLVDEGYSAEGKHFTTLTGAEVALTSYRNDVLIVAPGWYDEDLTTTWDLYDSHIIGGSPTGYQPRVDIVQNSTFTPMMTISGRGSSFRNLTFRHGTANTDLVGLLLSGRYCHFENVYWMTPMNAAQADLTTYIGIDISGHNNYFKRCRLGSDGTPRGAKNYNLKIRGTGNIFDECNFVVRADATSPHFINIETSDDRRFTWFKGCMFYVHYVNRGDQLLYAVERTGPGATADLIFDGRCMFCGVDKLIASAHEAYTFVPQTYNTTDLTLGLIGLAYDAD